MPGPLAQKSYSPDVISKVSQSLRHYYKVTAYTRDGDDIALDVLDLQIDYDEKRAPHISSRITCAIPEDQDTIDALDGRKGARVSVELGYDLDGGTQDSQIVADLMIGNVTMSYSDTEASMEITAFSEELRLQEKSLFTGDAEEISRTGIAEFVTSILDLFPSGMQEQYVAYDFPKDFGASQLAGLDNIEPGDNAWSLLEEAMDRTDTWVYCPLGRDWAVEKRPEIASTPHHTLEAGTNGTVISASRSTDRSAFYNMVILNYTWRNVPAVNEYKISGFAYISYGDFNVANGTKTYTEEIRKKATRAQADAAAKSKLARLMSKGHKYEVTALALYSVRPGQTIRLKLFGEDQNLLVQQVTFSPESGLMDLVLRKPERGEII